MRRLLWLAGSILLIPAAFAACGGDDDDAATDEPTTQPSATAAEGSASPAATGARSATATATTPTSGGGASSSSGGKGAGCEVSVSGDVTQSFKTKDELGAAGVSYWMPDEIRKNIVEKGQLFLILNCSESPTSGTKDRAINLNFIPGAGSTEEMVPHKAGRYVIGVGSNFGAAKAGQFGLLLGIGDALFGVSEAGFFNITRFDNDRVTAEFEFGATESFATGKARVIKVKGKLDFTCEPTRACK